jgi:hypothetical protein
MKTWLAKFRISVALDAGQPWPESLRRAVAADPALARFAQRTEILGRALRLAPPPVEPALRDSIMRAVRAAARAEPSRRAPVSVWRAATAAVAAVAVVCLWTAHHHPAPPGRQSLDGAVAVLEIGEQIPGAMPSLVMSPLSNEWDRMDRNLRDTTQVLLASFP